MCALIAVNNWQIFFVSYKNYGTQCFSEFLYFMRIWIFFGQSYYSNETIQHSRPLSICNCFNSFAFATLSCCFVSSLFRSDIFLKYVACHLYTYAACAISFVHVKKIIFEHISVAKGQLKCSFLSYYFTVTRFNHIACFQLLLEAQIELLKSCKKFLKYSKNRHPNNCLVPVFCTYFCQKCVNRI